VIIADTPSAFADAVIGLHQDSAEWREISAAGRRFVAEFYDWRSLGRALRAIHREQFGASPA
jgi:glycosyltransferase involved in cell wall biosynthesis